MADTVKVKLTATTSDTYTSFCNKKTGFWFKIFSVAVASSHLNIKKQGNAAHKGAVGTMLALVGSGGLFHLSE